MNKLILVALFAVIAGAVAEPEDPWTELSVVPSDDEETRYLSENNKIFSDYCIKSRDTIKSFITSAANHQAADVFEVIFTSVNDIGSNAIQAQDAAIDESATAIGHQAERQNRNLAQLVVEGARAVLKALIETAQSQLFQRLEILKAQFSAEGLKDKISAACNAVSYGLKSKLEESLTQTRNQMKASAAKQGAEGASMVDTISKARYDNIGCLTAGRIAKVQKFCDILNVAGSSIYPLLGI